MAKQKLVMIGNGMAGLRTIEEILERSQSQFDITIIGKEPYPNYNRIMLSNILQKKMTVEDTIMNPYDWYQENNIELINNDPVEKVDKENKIVTTSKGMEVTVLHLADWLMEMQLDRKAGEMLKADLEKQGMKIELQANSKEIIGDKDVEAIKLADGRVIETDLVVMAVGIRPYTEVAKDSGLDVNRGIVVNDYMQTSDSHIYAVGECAEHDGKVYG
ncbi:MAG: FAD-dependent oxidoreductase, partial [Staphylococcus epidermidis]|nr:FAD-dependent oxidoreductase [Staphylococcus epidermidis]